MRCSVLSTDSRRKDNRLDERERIIEEYVDGKDGGLTRRTMRSACDLPETAPTSVLEQRLQADGAYVGLFACSYSTSICRCLYWLRQSSRSMCISCCCYC